LKQLPSGTPGAPETAHRLSVTTTENKDAYMTTWVLVADNSRARIFSADKPASPLQEIRDLAHPEARLHEGDLVTDKGGRDRGVGGAHGVGNEQAHKQEGADKFAAQVCSELDAARNSGEFSKIYVVAAPTFLGLLRKHQSAPLKQLVAGEVDKNLSVQDPASIRKHLPEYL
jgi:protein required for attachment to host cells